MANFQMCQVDGVWMIVLQYTHIYLFIHLLSGAPANLLGNKHMRGGSKPVIFNHYRTLVRPPPPASDGGRKSSVLPYHYRTALDPFL